MYNLDILEALFCGVSPLTLCWVNGIGGKSINSQVAGLKCYLSLSAQIVANLVGKKSFFKLEVMQVTILL